MLYVYNHVDISLDHVFFITQILIILANLNPYPDEGRDYPSTRP